MQQIAREERAAPLLRAISMAVAAGVVAGLPRASPRRGTHAGDAAGLGGAFKTSFVVSSPMVIDGVQHVEITDGAHWHAWCASRRVWVDQSGSFWTSFRAWNEQRLNYVTANRFGNYARRSGGRAV